MTKISSSDVRKVAQLARLELPEDQIETYTAQLEEILTYVDQLQEIDTQNIPPTTRAVEVVNAMREDFVEVNSSREDTPVLSNTFCNIKSPSTSSCIGP